MCLKRFFFSLLTGTNLSHISAIEVLAELLNMTLLKPLDTNPLPDIVEDHEGEDDRLSVISSVDVSLPALADSGTGSILSHGRVSNLSSR